MADIRAIKCDKKLLRKDELKQVKAAGDNSMSRRMQDNRNNPNSKPSNPR